MAAQDLLEQIKNIDINDIDWSRMGVWPLSAKLFLCTVAAVVILVGTYFLVIKDLNIELQSAITNEATLRKDFEKKAHEAANLEVYRQQMAEMEKTFGTLLAQLPTDTEVPGLLEDIDEKGRESGLNIDSIQLQSERPQDFYIELPIQVKVTGTYHDLGAFVSGIASMARIVTLHDYTITSGKNSDLLDMTILAKTYRYKGQE